MESQDKIPAGDKDNTQEAMPPESAAVVSPEAVPQRIEKILRRKLDAGAVTMERGEMVVHVAAADIPRLLVGLTDDDGFTQLTDLTAVDYPDRKERFELVYQLLDVSSNRRLRVKARVADGTVMQSVSHVFASAAWCEREVWDMYGIFFSGHPDLRRLLTDYGFDGHPLRKDFPLTGTVETRYDAELGRVVYEPVQMEQEYRDFDFESPWAGVHNAVRRDEQGAAAAAPALQDKGGE